MKGRFFYMLRFNTVLSPLKTKVTGNQLQNQGQSGLGTQKHLKNSPKLDGHYYFKAPSNKT